MAIANVELSNTFNEFRTTTNQALGQLNSLEDGAGSIDVLGIVVNNLVVETSLVSTSVNANNLTSGRVLVAGTSGVIEDDAGLSYNTVTNALTVTGAVSTKNVSSSDLTSGRVAIVGTSGLIQDDSGLTFNATSDVLTVAGGISTTNVTASDLTSGRVAIVGTSGLVTDDAGLTYNSGTNALTVGGTLDVGGVATFTSNVSIAGDLLVTGNTVTFDVETKSITDPLIYLAANNYYTDLVDIGFIGHYNDGVGNNHTGIIRHATDERMYLFTGYEPEIGSNNIIDVNDPSFTPASIVAGNAELNYITANGTTSTTISATNIDAQLLILNDDDNSNSVRLQAPSTVASNVTFTLPDTGGSSGQLLSTDGSGNLSYVEPGASTGKAIAMAIVFGG